MRSRSPRTDSRSIIFTRIVRFHWWSMKNRKHSARQRIDTAERYRAKASDLFVWTDSDSPSERRNLETALVNIKRALLLDPDNYEFLVLAGDILCSLDDEASVAAALEYYERA